MANPVDFGSARFRHLHAHLDHGPAIDLRITGVIREGSNSVTPAAECDAVHVGDRLLGDYVATAGHRGRARLQVQPAPPPWTIAPKLPESSDDEREPSGTWELDTSHMRPSGYTLSLQILGRSPVGTSRCYGSVALNFFLQPRRM